MSSVFLTLSSSRLADTQVYMAFDDIWRQFTRDCGGSWEDGEVLGIVSVAVEVETVVAYDLAEGDEESGTKLGALRNAVADRGGRGGCMECDKLDSI